jgi:hypothetical protein
MNKMELCLYENGRGNEAKLYRNEHNLNKASQSRSMMVSSAAEVALHFGSWLSDCSVYWAGGESRSRLFEGLF